MSYRKLTIGEKVYEYTIGKSFVKIRHDRKPIPLSECGYKMGCNKYGEPTYFVTPVLLREYLTTGKVVQRDEICEKHNKPKFWASDPYSAEIEDNHTPCYACEDCFNESAMEI